MGTDQVMCFSCSHLLCKLNQENSNCQRHDGINYETHKTVNTGNIYGMLLCYEEKANEV